MLYSVLRYIYIPHRGVVTAGTDSNKGQQEMLKAVLFTSSLCLGKSLENRHSWDILYLSPHSLIASQDLVASHRHTRDTSLTAATAPLQEVSSRVGRV